MIFLQKTMAKKSAKINLEAFEMKTANNSPQPTRKSNIESEISIISSDNSEESPNQNQDFFNVLINFVCFCFIIFVFANYLFLSGIDTVLAIIIGFLTPEIFFSIVMPLVYFRKHPDIASFLLKKIQGLFKGQNEIFQEGNEGQSRT